MDGEPGEAGQDEDNDGVADDKVGHPCATPENDTRNGLDDDGDGYVDDDSTHKAGKPEPYGAWDDDDWNGNVKQDTYLGHEEGHWGDNGSGTAQSNAIW